MYFDVVIKGGLCYLGDGGDPVRSDVGIVGSRIEAIGDLNDAQTGLSVDAAGKVVCPGFVDTHSHSDLVVLKEPAVENKVMQGVTTELIGQDGMSLAPIIPEYREPWKKTMGSLEGHYDVPWDWQTAEEYFERIDSQDLGPNIAYLVPHGNMRLCVMGLDDREATDDEMAKMSRLLAKILEAGAYGMSTGMIYPPCCYAPTQEFVELCKVLKDADGLFVTHQRNESDYILEAMDEIFEIGAKSGCRVHFSHFKVGGKRNWDKLDTVLAKLDEANLSGIPLSFDQYPYIAGSTMLGVILPPWVHNGGTEKALERLADKNKREQMKTDIAKGIPGWDNFVSANGVENIYVTFVKTDKNSKYVGKTLLEIGKMANKDPLDATFDLLYEEEMTAGLVHFYGKEEHISKRMQREEQNFCTDGILGAHPHPRVYGTYPRVLGKYVRENKDLTMSQAIHKMTGKPASVLRLEKRGLLKEGYYADVVVFDPETVIDKATYDNPKQYPEGIEHVFVNGVQVVEKGVCKPAKAGRLLRK